MAFRSRRERRLWFAAGLCTLLIYSSLYLARPVAEYLRQRNLLRLAVALAFLATAALVVRWLWSSRASWRVLAVVGAIGLGYAVLLTAIPMMPEERLHFLEYGVVAALIYMALRERRARYLDSPPDGGDLLVRGSPLVTAVVITTAVGWIDEGIQGILPNRYYDLRDVIFNAAAGFACIGSIKLVEWARRHE